MCVINRGILILSIHLHVGLQFTALLPWKSPKYLRLSPTKLNASAVLLKSLYIQSIYYSTLIYKALCNNSKSPLKPEGARTLPQLL